MPGRLPGARSLDHAATTAVWRSRPCRLGSGNNQGGTTEGITEVRRVDDAT
jgi:hypothetical protein